MLGSERLINRVTVPSKQSSFHGFSESMSALVTFHSDYGDSNHQDSSLYAKNAKSRKSVLLRSARVPA